MGAGYSGGAGGGVGVTEATGASAGGGGTSMRTASLGKQPGTFVLLVGDMGLCLYSST